MYIKILINLSKIFEKKYFLEIVQWIMKRSKFKHDYYYLINFLKILSINYQKSIFENSNLEKLIHKIGIIDLVILTFRKNFVNYFFEKKKIER